MPWQLGGGREINAASLQAPDLLAFLLVHDTLYQAASSVSKGCANQIVNPSVQLSLRFSR